jgi:hypothetical protein
MVAGHLGDVFQRFQNLSGRPWKLKAVGPKVLTTQGIILLVKKPGSRLIGGEVRDFEDEGAAPAFLAFDANIAAMFLENLLTDGKAQTRTAISLGRFEDREDFADAVRADADAIVGNGDDKPLPRYIVSR